MLLEDFPFEPGFRLTDGDLLNKVASEPAYSVDNTVSATGTNQDMAYGLRATATVITAGGAGTGVRLPPPKIGRLLFVINSTASEKKVYPFDTETINGESFANLGPSTGMTLLCTGVNSWTAGLIETNTSGDVDIHAADADTATGDGHSVRIEAGAGGDTSGDGGNVTIQAGRSSGGTGGNLTLLGGLTGGQVILASAWALEDTPTTTGDVMVGSGPSFPGTTGRVYLQSGVSITDEPSDSTGDVSIASGIAINGVSGNVTVRSGPIVGDGRKTGNVRIETGKLADGESGDIIIRTGDASATGVIGDVIIQGGLSTSATVTGGSIQITAGSASNSPTGGGNVEIRSGNPIGKILLTSVGGPTEMNGQQVNGNSTVTGNLNVTGALALAGSIGFFNTPPVAKPTVTGSQGGNTALASLLAALVSMGLIIDTSTV